MRFFRPAGLVVLAALLAASPLQADEDAETPPPPPEGTPTPSPTPTGPPPLPVESYYIDEGGTARGPLRLVDLKPMIEAEEVTLETLVWKPGQAEWRPASAFPELKSLIAPEVPDLPEAPPFIVGVWLGEQEMEDGAMMRWKVRYNEDGTYVGSVSRQPAGEERPVVVPWSGTWDLEKIDDQSYVYTATEVLDGRSANAKTIITHVTDEDGAERFTFETSGIELGLVSRPLPAPDAIEMWKEIRAMAEPGARVGAIWSGLQELE